VNDAVLALGRAPDVVGREAERARVDAFVAALPHGARALVIRGEPGIGKTTLWRHGLAQCQAAGYRVLLTRPAEEEMSISLVGLVDLFEHVDLDAASPREDDNPFARGRAVLSVLRDLAESRPAVVAIDDVQWLDSASARALRYALRRFEVEPIGVLATERAGTEGDDPLAPASTFPPGRYEPLELGPLTLGALRRVLAGTVTTISRPLLRRIYETSGGNPLYAIELARVLATVEGATLSPEGLRLPDSLQAAIARRLDTVPAELAPVLEAAATLGPAPVKELREILPGLKLDELIATAEQHGLLVLDEALEVRFAHPLVGSAVYARMSPLARRNLHKLLAERVADPDVRARHLALSTDEADADVAELLEVAAQRARSRGVSDLAAEFARHSLRLTPPADGVAARRRALAEVEHLAAAGEAARALTLLDRLIARLPPGPARAEALVRRFYVESDDLESGDALLVQALSEAGDDDVLRGQVLDLLGWLRGMFRGDLRGGMECAREAVAIAERVGDSGLELLAAGHLGHMSTLAGEPRPDLMERAVALATEIGGPPLGGGPRAWLAKQTFWAGDLRSARAQFEAALDSDARSGNELERPYRLYDLALVECAAGNLGRAEELVSRGLEAARDAENADAEGWLLFPLSMVAAWRGQSADARAAAERLLEWAGRRGGLQWIVRGKSVLGLLALSEGDASAAAEELVDAADLLEQMGFAHPGALPILPDAVEALAQAGDTSSAGALLGRLERQAAALDSAWGWAVFERCRGVLLLANGEAEAAAEALSQTAPTFERLGYRPGAARAFLSLGRALARGGHRTLAADALADARGRFADIGATLWEARAVQELERAAPGRASGELTGTEKRIAGLVVRGMKNREIADSLFMSVPSVEAHLTRIYRKLSIRSRAELTRLVADGSLRASDER
jgi:DNA-binding CsgD family transcriptional regulator